MPTRIAKIKETNKVLFLLNNISWYIEKSKVNSDSSGKWLVIRLSYKLNWNPIQQPQLNKI